MPPVPQRPDGTIPLSIYEIELEQLAEDYAEKIAKFGLENVSVFESNTTPEELAAELEQEAGQTYDLDAEVKALEQRIRSGELVESPQDTGVSDSETQEDIDPADALAAMEAEMAALGL
jgi:thiol-disulfide isomerase/thioredoxin